MRDYVLICGFNLALFKIAINFIVHHLTPTYDQRNPTKKKDKTQSKIPGFYKQNSARVEIYYKKPRGTVPFIILCFATEQ